MPTTGTMKYLQIGDATYEIYNTDQKVSQSYKAASGYTYWRPLLIGYSSGSAANFTPADQTDLSYTFETLKVQPSTGTIRFGAAALTNSGYTNTISVGTLTANRTLTAPDKSGTIAVTSDLHNIPSGGSSGQVLAKASGTDYDLEWTTVSSGGGTVTSVGLTNATNGGLSVSNSPITSSGTITVGHSNVLTSAQTTSGIYPIKIDKNGHISEYGNAVSIPTISLNGSSTTSASFYAPTSAGTSGQVLISSGSGAPSWSTLSSDVFYADYGVTSYTDINDAIDAGKEVILRDATTLASINVVNYYYLYWRYTREASYKYIVFTDGTNYVSIENDGYEDTWTVNQMEYHSLRFTNGVHNIVIEAPDTIENTNKSIILPDKSGTIALTNDIPTVPTKTSDITNDSGFLDKSDILDIFYPIGSYYETSDSSFDPNISWGGLWILELEGQTHVSGSIDGEYTVRVGWNESNGGESRVKLQSYESGQKALTISSSGGHKHTVTAHYNAEKVASGSARAQWSAGGSSNSTGMAEIDSNTGTHTHTISGSEAENAHENMPPYIVVYRWHRVDPDLIGYATLVLLDTTQITLMYSLELDTDDQQMWWANWCQSGFNNIGAMKDSNYTVILPNGNYISPDGSSLLSFDTPISTYQTYYETQV